MGIAYGAADCKYENLSEEDIIIINDVIRQCGMDSKEQIVKRMHKEKAYYDTLPGDIINYGLTKELSII